MRGSKLEKIADVAVTAYLLTAIIGLLAAVVGLLTGVIP